MKPWETRLGYGVLTVMFAFTVYLLFHVERTLTQQVRREVQPYLASWQATLQETQAKCGEVLSRFVGEGE